MLTTDRIGGSALCMLGLFVMWESRALPLGTWRQPGRGYFPALLAALLLILGALVWAMAGGAAPVAGVGWGEARHALVILAAAVTAFALSFGSYYLFDTLLLPATFGLTATNAIVMPAGIYYGAMYGGSTTSILMRIPGGAASVMTCIDGYAMARKGRAGAADPDFKSAMDKLETPIAFKQGAEFQKFFEVDAQRLAEGVRKVGRGEQE